MNGNSLGKIFKITTWGESHGPAVGVIIDGCPSGLPICAEDFTYDLARRQGGQSAFITARKEPEEIFIESGVFEGKTTGTPIALRIENKNINSDDYANFKNAPRPGHADLTTQLKQGHRDHRGGGRSSARETTARVMAGVVAKKILKHFEIEILAWVSRVGPMAMETDYFESAESGVLEQLRAVRDGNSLGILSTNETTQDILQAVETIKVAGDSWGGNIQCIVKNLPAGLGEPVFDKLNAQLAHSLMSLPAAVSFNCGGGDHFSHLPGSALRDSIGKTEKGIRPLTNKHGGLLGGMSTGLPLRLEVAFHAPTSIARDIETWNFQTNNAQTINVTGRHDSFPLPRAIPMVEAMVAIVLVDALFRQRSAQL